MVPIRSITDIASGSCRRRIDDEPVVVVQYTGGNLDEVRALVGAGYRVAESAPDRLTLTREHPQERVVVSAWDWIVRDGQWAHAVRSFAFRGNCREVPVERRTVARFFGSRRFQSQLNANCLGGVAGRSVV